MAGHSKWAQIKRQKSVNDARKSQTFGKLARLIASESKRAGGNTSAPGLREAIARAKRENMPSENIERAVLKGKGDTGADSESVLYEAYGVGGVAILIEGLTDNKNRTSQELKHLLSKHGAQLAAPGAAAWAFAKNAAGAWEPQSTIHLSDQDTEALAALVEQLENHVDVQEVTTNAA